MSGAGKDLFRAVFDVRSKFAFETFRRGLLEQLPVLLLDTAKRSAPVIVSRANYKDVECALAAVTSTASGWKNPELYPYLNYLAFADAHFAAEWLDALLVHCGKKPLSERQIQTASIWRLNYGRDEPRIGSVIEIADGTLAELPNLCWTMRVYDATINVFRPRPGLFDDVASKLYGEQESEARNENIASMLSQAFALIGLYCPNLAVNVVEQLSTLAVLRDIKTRPISFSLRNRFIGAAFITLASPAEMAEQIIHEYYHQCIWPWWLVEQPPDLPSCDRQIVSPISKSSRPLPTLMQAVLIYASLRDFHQFALELDSHDARVRERIAGRAESIRSYYSELLDAVLAALCDRPLSKRFIADVVDTQREIFQ